MSIYQKGKQLLNRDLVYGIQPVITSLQMAKDIDKIFVDRQSNNEQLKTILSIADNRRIPVLRVPPAKLNSLTTKNHQGVIAFMAAISFASLDHIISNTFSNSRNPLLLILDGVTDVRNFGSICRTAVCAGVNAVIIPEKNTAPVGSDAMKTSTGALRYIDICRSGSLARTAKYLLDSGVQLIACTERGKASVYTTDFKLPTAIIMGAEKDGISAPLLKRASVIRQIPMKGPIGALNVSVAAGIILFEALRQRS